jgi:hypothetical protein
MMPLASDSGHTSRRSRTSARRILVVLALFGVFATGGALLWNAKANTRTAQAPADTIQAAADTTALPHRVTAYYLHTTFRCASCRKIEAFTKEAIETGFADELKDGRLVFRVVNVEEKGNEHFVKDFKIFTKSVVLVDERSGKQIAWKNLPKVWELLGDKEGFLRYIREETRAYLADKQS